MSVTSICGINWGDEGKGRMVDYFAQNADMVIRYQGGNNAGHTVINQFGKFALHHLPSGVFSENVMNIIGNGAVINPEALTNEIDDIEKIIGRPINLIISERCHIIFPFHILLDIYEEERLKENKFGSTKKGIAPVYSDKYLKIGILSSDLTDKDYLYKRLKHNLELKNQVFSKIYGKPEINLDEMVEWGYTYGKKITKYIGNPIPMIKAGIDKNKNILLEGQLGALRDIEFGIYPFTTSSSPIPGYAPTGCSIPPSSITKIIGVMKSYSTCVGEGPFTTEIFSEIANQIREKGKEYGASTGRPRRIGWFDVVASKYGCDITFSTEIALTLLDVLSGIKEIKVCTKYKIDDKEISDFPTTQKLIKAKPEYIICEGWDEDISMIKKFNKLPKNTRIYILKLEELLNVKIKYISVGPERDQLIIR